MPASYINDPKHWRERAAEMRALAEDIKDAEAKATMLRLAADYDKLAARAVARADGNVPPSRCETRPGRHRCTVRHVF